MSCPKIYFKSKKCTNKNPPKNFIIFLGGLDKKKSYLNDIAVISTFFPSNIERAVAALPAPILDTSLRASSCILFKLE